MVEEVSFCALHISIFFSSWLRGSTIYVFKRMPSMPNLLLLNQVTLLCTSWGFLWPCIDGIRRQCSLCNASEPILSYQFSLSDVFLYIVLFRTIQLLFFFFLIFSMCSRVIEAVYWFWCISLYQSSVCSDPLNLLPVYMI